MKIERIINKFLKRTIDKKAIKEIDYNELKKLLKENTGILLIDVRSPQEFSEGRINSAINIPLYDISKKANVVLKNKEENIIVYCQSGNRSKEACKILLKLGYSNLYNLKGGLNSI